MNPSEWEDTGEVMDDGYYGKWRHIPCGRVVWVLMGHGPVCSKCEPEEWATLKGPPSV